MMVRFKSQNRAQKLYQMSLIMNRLMALNLGRIQKRLQTNQSSRPLRYIFCHTQKHANIPYHEEIIPLFALLIEELKSNPIFYLMRTGHSLHNNSASKEIFKRSLPNLLELFSSMQCSKQFCCIKLHCQYPNCSVLCSTLYSILLYFPHFSQLLYPISLTGSSPKSPPSSQWYILGKCVVDPGEGGAFHRSLFPSFPALQSSHTSIYAFAWMALRRRRCWSWWWVTIAFSLSLFP